MNEPEPKLIINEHGSKYYIVDNEYHRNGGPAIEYFNGTKSWYFNGYLHRKDGSAIEGKNGGHEWWFNGNLHRADGPAIEYINGDKEWWLNDKEYTQEEWFQQLTPEQQYNYLWNLNE